MVIIETGMGLTCVLWLSMCVGPCTSTVTCVCVCVGGCLFKCDFTYWKCWLVVEQVTTRYAGQRAAFQGPVAFHEVSISEILQTMEGEMGFFSLYPAVWA